MKSVIELIRVSTEDQAADNRASIPAQRAVNRRTCAQYDLEIVKSIEMSDVSGASVLGAPEMEELLRLIESPDVHGVVAREFSRLMRPEKFTDFTLLQAFADTGTVLYLPEGPIDLSSKTGRLMGTIRAAIAGLERTEILERIWSAKEEKRRRGELAQSRAVLPFGVGYDAGRGFFYKPEAEKVREAFRQFLAGNQSYSRLAHIVGVTPRGMHVIMRNPIWTGWRVIDMKRDNSAAGRYSSLQGRQADRKKIARKPEDVIRVRVIDDPIVSESDFGAVQALMNQKQKRHWRSRPDYEHRFTYNGFLTCSACGETVHTALARHDYYACKGRRTAHVCRSKYMARQKLETILDDLFALNLTSRSFLERCIAAVELHYTQDASASRIQRLNAQISSVTQKRQRVVDSFIEGLIDRAEREKRLATLDGELRLVQDVLKRESPLVSWDAKRLIQVFGSLLEWKYWTRAQKRAVLLALVPDIRVADYEVQSLGLNPAIFSNEDNHTDRDSSPRPA